MGNMRCPPSMDVVVSRDRFGGLTCPGYRDETLEEGLSNVWMFADSRIRSLPGTTSGASGTPARRTVGLTVSAIVARCTGICGPQSLGNFRNAASVLQPHLLHLTSAKL